MNGRPFIIRGAVVEPVGPRVLSIGPLPDGLPFGAAVVATSAADAADRIRSDHFDLVIAQPKQAAQLIDRYRRDETILASVDQGIASLDATGRITWANATLKDWSGSDPVGKTILETLGPGTIAAETANPTETRGGEALFRIHQPPPSKHPYLDVRLRPVVASDGSILHSVAIIQNVTAQVEQQKKLDALHQAGRDLACLEPEQLSEMNIPTRIEYLKQNLRGYVHNLLHYDTMEVRLLDHTTDELMPLVEDGMTEEAAQRRLFRSEAGNGVTGHVAFTGESYLAPDTSKEALYLEGAKGAKSSLTVPLKYNDQVIGTLNVESPRVNGFGPDDLQFTELLSRELANALHTLDLLRAQQTCTLSASIEAVNKEIALPVDEVLGSAALLYARLHAKDPETAKALRRIMDSARSVKDCVNKVHRSMSPAECFSAPANLAGKRVLVVEQVEQHRRTIHLMLRRLGVDVETVADPREGLALCDGTSYDAIFLELKPQHMRGSEAFLAFRQIEPDARVSLTTGYGYDECHTRPACTPHGLTALLFKPFKIDQVTKALTAPAPPPLAVAASC